MDLSGLNSVGGLMTAVGASGLLATGLGKYMNRGKEKQDLTLNYAERLQKEIVELRLEVKALTVKVDLTEDQKNQLLRAVFWMLAKCTCGAGHTVPLPPWVDPHRE